MAETTQTPSFLHKTGGYLKIRGALLTALFTICIVVGVVFKVIAFYAAWRHRKGRLGALSVLVMSLMVAGLIHLLLVVPFEVTEVAHPSWSFGEAFCKAYEYQKYVDLYAIAYHLVLIATYLLLEAVQPQAAGKLDRPWTLGLVLGVAWSVFFLANIPHVYGHGTHRFPGSQRTYCFTEGFHENRRIMQEWGAVNFIFLFVLPAVLMTVASGLLCWKILTGRGRQGLLEPAVRHRDFSVTVTALTVAFIVLWGVPRVQSLLQIFAVIDPHHRIVRDVGNVFLHGLLPAVLPVIFLLGIREYRQVATCCRRQVKATAANGVARNVKGNCNAEETGVDNPDENAKL